MGGVRVAGAGLPGAAIVKDGKTLESADENIAELTAQAQACDDKLLPILKVLQIA